jgi:hypothetical protein
VPRLRIGFLAVVCFCAFSSLCLAQSDPATNAADPSSGGPAKLHARKSAHKDATHAVAPPRQNAEEAEKAARIAAARKKFFEQSEGFDSGTPSTIFLGGNGPAPGAGFRF